MCPVSRGMQHQAFCSIMRTEDENTFGHAVLLHTALVCFPFSSRPQCHTPCTGSISVYLCACMMSVPCGSRRTPSREISCNLLWRGVAGSRCMRGQSGCPGGSLWRWPRTCTRAWRPWRALCWPEPRSCTTATPCATSPSPPSSTPLSSASPRCAPPLSSRVRLYQRCMRPMAAALMYLSSALSVHLWRESPAYSFMVVTNNLFVCLPQALVGWPP